jgi:hypothetical protein
MTNGSDPAVMTVKNPLRMTKWSETGLVGQPSSCRAVYEVEDGRNVGAAPGEVRTASREDERTAAPIRS